MVVLAVCGVVDRPIPPEAPCTGHVRRVMAAAYVASDHAGDAVTDEELTYARKGDACNLPRCRRANGEADTTPPHIAMGRSRGAPPDAGRLASTPPVRPFGINLRLWGMNSFEVGKR